ncbi:hypothetical protein J7J81_00580 [bacterium]|nr:hypothetical protein [bacterium]
MENQIFPLNLKQGTISFWVGAGKLNWNNNQRTLLFEASRDEGKISIIKDAKNILRAFYQLKGEKRKEVSIKVGDLSNKRKHQVAFTWSQKENEIILYLDGEKVGENKIK